MHTQPEYHSSWLAAMGVAQWQLRAVVATPAADDAWPEPMCHASHWLVGEALDATTEPLLQAIMTAIGVKMAQVVYCAADDEVLHVTSSVPESVEVFNFGALTHAWQSERITILPSLTAMLAQPERKREAWAALKPLVRG